MAKALNVTIIQTKDKAAKNFNKNIKVPWLDFAVLKKIHNVNQFIKR
tara:strand:- start:60775 stop:60915 length:141 start_codon:yes stop_codon:yes gene_type:complete